MKILVINGVNLNMLGIREPALYGKADYNALIKSVKSHAKEIGVKVKCFQSNFEGEIVTAIQKAYRRYDGIVLNAGAYTHTSVAILDALKAVALPAVEVHLSKVSEREDFRQISYAGMACLKRYEGLGFDGYREAIRFLKDCLQKG